MKKHLSLFFRVITGLSFLGVFLGTPLSVGFFITQSAHLSFLQQWTDQNILVVILFLVVVKSIGIIFPPIPGNALTFLSVPFIGWFGAYLIDLVGSVIGSSIAYYLGNRYGRKFLQYVFGKRVMAQIDKIHIKKNREVESIFMLRLMGGVLSEFVCFAAGMLKVEYRQFLLGHMLAHVVFGIPFFFLIHNIFAGQNVWVSGVVGVLAMVLLYKLKGRYFE